MMEEKDDWASPSLKEAPFWREGMSPEEYDTERDYFYKHLEELHRGEYLPLWKQNNVNKPGE